MSTTTQLLHNFSAGPCISPQSVLQQASDAVRELDGSGLSLIEMSHRSKAFVAVMEEARSIVGERPTYCSFDIDFVDPTYAPGTGTPEIGGPNAFQAQQVIRALRGVDIVGADLVEVSPPFDPSGGTAWLGVSLIFELMCVLAESIDRRR